MTKLIGVFGRKGGTGKTIVSHLISHGLAKLGSTTFLLQTDVRTHRPTEVIDGRKYMYLSVKHDITDVKMLDEVLNLCSSIPNSTLVVDGGANRRKIDLVYASLVDMILIPTVYSQEDLAIAEADYYELAAHLRKIGSKAKIYIVLNRWPGVARKRKMIESKQWVIDYLDRWYAMGMMFPLEIPDMPSLIEMASTDDPKYTALIDNKAKEVARIVAKVVELATNEDEDYEPLTGDEIDGVGDDEEDVGTGNAQFEHSDVKVEDAA